jgi:hypothetical protein
MGDTRPLVLLDVDGVLNLGLFASSKKRSSLQYHHGWYSGRAGGDPYGERIFLNRAWGPMLRSLAEEGAELAWASAWMQAANWYIGPLLGLPELRWAPAVHRRKAYSVVPWTEGRPWAWLEDYEDELTVASGLSAGRPHCPVLVDRATGLTGDHVETVRQWLKSL